MKPMNLKCAILFGTLFQLSTAVLAQDIFPAKDLAFAQIAAGGGYETVLNITNRGTSAYSGTLTLIPSDPARPFVVLANGTPVSGGLLSLTIAAGATTSLRITSGNASLGAQTGFATISASDRTQASLLEGNLTYYVKSADGTILDSIGVAPSNEVFQTVIPFDDFFTVALALANKNQQATVKLTLFDDKNAQMGTPATQVLANNQQVPKFLYQYFPGITLTKGRVEIQSDHLILGTALTFVAGGQASSLPFLPSMKLYNYSITAGGYTFTGKAYFALNGPHVIGYYHGETQNGASVSSDLVQMSGVFINGDLQWAVYVEQSVRPLFSGLFPGYSPLLNTCSGSVVVYLANLGVTLLGTCTLIALN